jgi:hypothetical protein
VPIIVHVTLDGGGWAMVGAAVGAAGHWVATAPLRARDALSRHRAPRRSTDLPVPDTQGREAPTKSLG